MVRVRTGVLILTLLLPSTTHDSDRVNLFIKEDPLEEVIQTRSRTPLRSDDREADLKNLSPERVYTDPKELACYYLHKIETGDYAYHNKFRKVMKEVVKYDPNYAGYLYLEYSKLLSGRMRERYYELGMKLLSEASR